MPSPPLDIRDERANVWGRFVRRGSSDCGVTPIHRWFSAIPDAEPVPAKAGISPIHGGMTGVVDYGVAGNHLFHHPSSSALWGTDGFPLRPTPFRFLLLLRSRPEGLHEIRQEFRFLGEPRMGIGKLPDPAVGVEKPSHTPHTRQLNRY